MSYASRSVARPKPRGKVSLTLAACCCTTLLAALFGLKSCVGAIGFSQQLTPSRQASAAEGRAAAAARHAYTTAPVAEPPEDLISIKQRRFTPSAEHMEYAVVEYSGRQHMVVEGGMYETYFIRAVPGAKVRLNRVLLLKQKNSQTGEFEVSVGQPLVDGAYIDITILEHLKSEDQEILKHKKKKHYMKRWIVQQKLTRFRIDKIVKASDDAAVEGLAPFPLWQEGPPGA
eukprot:TRINITY_DN2572_c1_g1_i1.p1 TRINITY_DN2572_c1_g1~~TRINITY_DN2572_c1_g1_i1.p1  ORF type:complete len:244 (+),score=63.14 TRINITY_DN2572_c1_g1_i1:43-732(+)